MKYSGRLSRDTGTEDGLASEIGAKIYRLHSYTGFCYLFQLMKTTFRNLTLGVGGERLIN